MKNASLIGLIGVIVQILLNLIWWIVPYTSYHPLAELEKRNRDSEING